MMRREGGRVHIELSEDEFTTLLCCVGFAVGATTTREARFSWLRLANAINEGNPAWTPYEVPAK